MSATGCGGCNDGCLDESVQLQQGAQGDQGEQGIQGERGERGAQGDPGAAVIDYKVEDYSSTSSSWTQVYSKTIPANVLEIAYDHITVEMVLMCNLNSVSTGGQFGVRVLLGTPNMLPATMFDTINAAYISESTSTNINAIKLVFDIVCVGADTVATRMHEFKSGYGLFIGDDYAFFALPDLSGFVGMDFSTPTTTQTVDTSVNNTLSIRLKSTDNSTAFTLNSVKITYNKS